MGFNFSHPQKSGGGHGPPPPEGVLMICIIICLLKILRESCLMIFINDHMMSPIG